MPRRSFALLSAVSLTGVLLTGCSGASPAPGTTAPSASPSGTGGSSTAAVTSAPPSCVARTYAALTPAQRVGQLVMVALPAGTAPDDLAQTIERYHLGGVFFLGGWRDASVVTKASGRLQASATAEATGGVALFVAADQEGGQIQQLRGQGFSAIPGALTQATLAPAELQRRAATWGRELKAAGVNVDLAPVADTVPADIGRANGPIGRWGREYGSTPEAVSPPVQAFVRGLRSVGVAATLKHFPGIGRIRGNTDFTNAGVTDSVTTPQDPFLSTFSAGIDAGADVVMVGSARYSKIDPDNPAMYSPAVIEGLLRGRLGYAGLVVTDDLNAAAAKDRGLSRRATSFVQAGGDVVLDGNPAHARVLTESLLARAQGSTAFADRVQASVTRVLTVKDSLGLLPCS